MHMVPPQCTLAKSESCFMTHQVQVAQQDEPNSDTSTQSVVAAANAGCARVRGQQVIAKLTFWSTVIKPIMAIDEK
jgi:hypothetical protein